MILGPGHTRQKDPDIRQTTATTWSPSKQGVYLHRLGVRICWFSDILVFDGREKHVTAIGWKLFYGSSEGSYTGARNLPAETIYARVAFLLVRAQ